MKSQEESTLQRFISKALEAAPKARDHYDRLIKDRTGSSGKPLYDIQRGKSVSPSLSTLEHISVVLGQPLDLLIRADRGERVDPIDDQAQVAQDDPSDAEVEEWDIAYGMGQGTYLDLPVTGTTHRFSRDWLRTFTSAPPEKLFIARGTGDSMFPTILDSDMVMVDTSQNEIRMGDRIWAVAYGDIGLIKRIRPMPDGSVKILSDNPNVPPETAYDGEMQVVGRVVAIVRKT